MTLTSISSPSFSTSLDALDARVRDLGDVQEAVGVGQDLDEGAEVDDALDRALVDRADLGLGGEALDDVDRLFTASESADATLTVPSSSTSMATPVWSTMPLMVLPPGPMMRRIWSGLTLRVVMRGAYCDELAARLAERLEHLAEDVEATFARLIERLGQDGAREAGDLDVHLDGGDALRRCRRP